MDVRIDDIGWFTVAVGRECTSDQAPNDNFAQPACHLPNLLRWTMIAVRRGHRKALRQVRARPETYQEFRAIWLAARPRRATSNGAERWSRTAPRSASKATTVER